VVLNNGGKFIVSESEDKKMRIWDKRNKRWKKKIEDNKKFCNYIDLKKNNKYVI
jgi:hypothetical protein